MHGKYVVYNSTREVRNLDLNTVDGNKATEFPSDLYAGEPFPVAHYVCNSTPRNSSRHYVFHQEREKHPDYFSRYSIDRFAGYPEFIGGYGFGIWPGRLISPPDTVDYNYQPKDMAPCRLYAQEFISPLAPQRSYSDEMGRKARSVFGAIDEGWGIIDELEKGCQDGRDYGFTLAPALLSP